MGRLTPVFREMTYIIGDFFLLLVDEIADFVDLVLDLIVG